MIVRRNNEVERMKLPQRLHKIDVDEDEGSNCATATSVYWGCATRSGFDGGDDRGGSEESPRGGTLGRNSAAKEDKEGGGTAEGRRPSEDYYP